MVHRYTGLLINYFLVSLLVLPTIFMESYSKSSKAFPTIFISILSNLLVRTKKQFPRSNLCESSLKQRSVGDITSISIPRRESCSVEIPSLKRPLPLCTKRCDRTFPLRVLSRLFLYSHLSVEHMLAYQTKEW